VTGRAVRAIARELLTHATLEFFSGSGGVEGRIQLLRLTPNAYFENG
jgi:hypothetical protein